MPDPDPSPPSQAAKRPHHYPIGTLPATPSLGDLLRDRIQQAGPLRFPDFMSAALYEADRGYYASGTRQIGQAGDFFTSVSVGPLFGDLLARRFLRHWLESGSPSRWRIIECGAHDASLAKDVITSLGVLSPAAAKTLEYVIAEPLPTLRIAQATTLGPLASAIRFVRDPLELADHPLPGLAFGNELLDALPFHLVERQGDQWLECLVDIATDGGFAWASSPIDDPMLLAALARIAGHFPDGYRTEVRTCYHPLLGALASGLISGLMLWIDYGFARPDYYHPLRSAGTLRTFSHHRAGENPLESLGLVDITAHVDFTAVAEAAIALGGRPLAFSNQGSWLTAIARDWLLAQEGAPQPAMLRQFQMLTHPCHLGSRFHVLELSWNPLCFPLDSSTLDFRLFGPPASCS